MKFKLVYGFNNMSVTKFREYEIKQINDIKYVVPVVNTKRFTYSVIDYRDYEEEFEG